VIRPRNLTDRQRANILEWATRLTAGAQQIYPEQISFNQDHNDPKYKAGSPLNFVKHLGRAALGEKPPGSVSMFSSEFVWSLLALRDCDPKSVFEQFAKPEVPSCIKEPMRPMHATGDFVAARARTSYVGLVEGPLMVIDALNLPARGRDRLLRSVFVGDPGRRPDVSTGHRSVAQSMNPRFAKLDEYYLTAYDKSDLNAQVRSIVDAFNKGLVQNYSETSFLINTLLPDDNTNRTMDYVATILIE
jgi:hypothetical protein